MLNLDELKAVSQERPIEIFQFLIQRGCTWPELLREHLYAVRTPEERMSGQAVVKYLLEKRDRLDEILYEKAVMCLFNDEDKPRESQLNSYTPPEWRPTGIKNDLTGPKLMCYEIVVKEKKGANSRELIRVRVVAPGSRDLLSDIDTTIEVTHSNLTAPELENCLPPLLPSDSDPNILRGTDPCLALQAAIVYHFNQLNLAYFGITSALSRDSNVYSKDFSDNPVFLKFGREEDLTLEVNEGAPGGEVRLVRRSVLELSGKPIKELFIVNKQEKQAVELAASFFSLREYYEDARDWNALFSYFDTHAPFQAIQHDFSTLMRKIRRQVDSWFEEKCHEKNRLRQGTDISAQRFRDGYFDFEKLRMQRHDIQINLQEMREQGLDVAIDNQLYFNYLLIVAKIMGEIRHINLEALKQTLQDAQTVLNGLDQELQELAQGLTTDPNISFAVKKALEAAVTEKKRDRAFYFDGAYKQAKDAYLEAVKKIVDLKCQLQAAQVKANLYANEAYINLSAVYHTVHWAQSQDERLKIDRRQVVMCSVLQQAGFRLLHAKHYRAAGLPEGEILYRVAKYDQRIADMFYGPPAAWFGDRSAFFGQPYDTPHAILSRLTKGQTEVNSPAFNSHIFPLLDRGIKLVREVKKNAAIPVEQKGWKAYLLAAKEYLNHSEHLLTDQMRDEDVHALMNLDRQDKFNRWIIQNETEIMQELIKQIVIQTFKVKLEAADQDPRNGTPAQVVIWGHNFHRPK